MVVSVSGSLWRPLAGNLSGNTLRARNPLQGSLDRSWPELPNPESDPIPACGLAAGSSRFQLADSWHFSCNPNFLLLIPACNRFPYQAWESLLQRNNKSAKLYAQEGAPQLSQSKQNPSNKLKCPFMGPTVERMHCFLSVRKETRGPKNCRISLGRMMLCLLIAEGSRKWSLGVFCRTSNKLMG